ncbi:hypothetical protein BDF14DRAFT_1883008 [Spinellus fusiger]|nr:hypothetical protein BDF14DRAFT_1883008 [Spinellus fusiger]
MKGLVDYDSCSSDEETDLLLKKRPAPKENAIESAVEKKRYQTSGPFLTSLPPLPAVFQGRTTKGQGQHGIDSWATRVYAKISVDATMQKILDHLQNKDITTCVREQSLHISLSRCISLRQYQLDDFVVGLREDIGRHKRFSLSFAQISVLRSDTSDASFVTAEVGAGYNELLACMSAVDKAASRLRQPEFYKPPRFHASLVRANSLDLLQQAKESLPVPWIEELRAVSMNITRLYVSMGHTIEKSISLTG